MKTFRAVAVFALAVLAGCAFETYRPWDPLAEGGADWPFNEPKLYSDCHFREELFRTPALNAALEDCCGLPPRNADGEVSCAWFVELEKARRSAVFELVTQLLDGSFIVPASPALSYDWMTELSYLNKTDMNFALSKVLLDPSNRKKIVEDASLNNTLVTEVEWDLKLLCLGGLAMEGAARYGHEEALLWVYESELAYAKQMLGPLADQVLSADSDIRSETMIGPQSNLEAFAAIEGFESALYIMHLKGYDVPEEAQARLKAIVRGDYVYRLNETQVIGEPTEALGGVSTIFRRYCP